MVSDDDGGWVCVWCDRRISDEEAMDERHERYLRGEINYDQLHGFKPLS